MMLRFLILTSLATPAAAAEIVWRDAWVLLSDGDSGYAMQAGTGVIEKIRLLGFDTPEIGAGHADCAIERQHAMRAGVAAQRLVTTRRIEVAWQDEDGDGQIDRDRYDRGLGTIWFVEDGTRAGTLYEALVGAELALPYEGGTRSDWCRYLKLKRPVWPQPRSEPD